MEETSMFFLKKFIFQLLMPFFLILSVRTLISRAMYDNEILIPSAEHQTVVGRVPGSIQGNGIAGPEVLLSQNWYFATNIPNPTYYGGGIGYQNSNSEYIYVIGGNGTGTGTDKVVRYNINLNTWEIEEALPMSLRLNAVALLRDSLYSVGGMTANYTYTNSVFKYGINENHWESRASFPTLAAFSKAVGYQDSLIYVAGGSDGSATFNTVYLYNAVNNTWRNATPMPSGRVSGAFTRSGDTLVYIGGASLPSNIHNTTFRGVINQYNRSIISWTSGAPFPAGQMFRMDANPWGCKGVIVTGGSSEISFSSTSNVCYSYSPGSNTWTQLNNKPTPWTCGQSGTVLHDDGAWISVCASGWGGSSVLSSTEIFYSFHDCSMVGIINNRNVPLDFELKQNYPNPFNSETVIEFSIPERAKVKVSVFDITGKKVINLIEDYLNPGKYTLNWNADNYPSGVYIYKIYSISSEGSTVHQGSKKMILLK
jgi:N-acetylneuraminic acid mutarotase